MKRNPEVASDMVCSLVSRGAIFRNRNSIDVIDKLELEFKRHKDNIFFAYVEYIDNAHKLIKAARSATNGRMNNARMDNAVLYLEYSENSTINVAMVTDVVRDLELNQKEVKYHRNIIKVGKSEVEIITENGIRNYANLAAVVLKVNRKIDVAVNKYLKFVWAYLFTAMLLLYRNSFRAILLSKQSTVSY